MHNIHAALPFAIKIDLAYHANCSVADPAITQAQIVVDCPEKKAERKVQLNISKTKGCETSKMACIRGSCLQLKVILF